MSRPPWFKHDPEHTATGYRWLDLLTHPYWIFAGWWEARKLWKLMAVNESWRQARTRTRAHFQAVPCWGCGDKCGSDCELAHPHPCCGVPSLPGDTNA